MPRNALAMARAMAIVATTLEVAACASGARPGAMTVGAAPGTTISDTSPLRYAVTVGTVAGGGATNPLWKSDVSDDDFRQALEQSLSLHAMLAGTPRYLLNAQLKSLDQPLIEFQATVTATVHYTLILTADRRPVWDQTLTTSYTAKVGDALVGPERIRLANEGAMRENIKLMLGLVIASIR